jgi:peptidoglycan/LPS O-acetylase OafA/YrhL
LSGRPPIRIRDYTRRRVLRIVPAYWVALVVLAVVLGLPAFWDGPWWRSFTFTQIYWASSTVQGIFPAWTLCIEITFYLALPFIAAAVGRLAGTRWRLEIALIACARARRSSSAPRSRPPAARSWQNTLLAFMGWFAIGWRWPWSACVTPGARRSAALRSSSAGRGCRGGRRGRVLVHRHAARPAAGLLSSSTRHQLPGEHVMYAVCATLLLLPRSSATARRWRGRAGLAVWLAARLLRIFLYHGRSSSSSPAQRRRWIPGSGYLSMTGVALAITVPLAAAELLPVERPALSFKDGFRSSRRRDASRASAPDATAASARQAAGLSGSASAASRASGSA